MRPNHLLLLAALFFFTTGYSQRISISKELPESEDYLVGTWKSKIISSRGRELIIIDTLAEQPQRLSVEIGPQDLGKVKKFGFVNSFIHDQFHYEIYFVMPTANDVASNTGYNVIVKRDLETMKIVTQKTLKGLFGQMKFVKMVNDGFYLCLGDSYTYINGLENFIYISPPEEVIPQKITCFNYDLEEFQSIQLNNFFGRSPNENSISFDEDGYLLIPTFFDKVTDDDGKVTESAKVLFQIFDLKGEVAKTNLRLGDDLDPYRVNAIRIKYNLATKTLRGILIIAKPSESTLRTFSKWGYMHAEWKEDGTLIHSNLEWMNPDDFFEGNMAEYVKTAQIKLESSSLMNLDSFISYFEIQDNGDALYIVNTLFPGPNQPLRNSKFILCISNKGTVKWKNTIPYTHNGLYKDAFYFVENNELHMFTREFTQNFATGTYVFNDAKVSATSKTIRMGERIIDVKTGELISHKPVIENFEGKQEPASIFRLSEKEFVIRYRHSKGNTEKWVVLSY